MKKINITNTEKLAAAIREAEGRATARTVTVADIINTLDRIKVPKSKLSGTKVHWSGGQKFPSAYKFRPDSTHWTAENVSGKWYVTNIWRDTCPNVSTYSGIIQYSEAAKEWILEKASII